ncbi:serine protease inhibitor 27A-like [Sitodiplosis mosellana]|uniref:serine protease inhibitor 27A-like n=1 Tax=Sitodiplosis mosellana TaxID=263140 RepID=UPI002444B552|nr:serine protease inhibitor 27A-like [Sitodiplosis mosellana]XP_055302787.1 serine protease inhibitor 27A-like [Sitodiplosis mosellana]XP_055302788.1 serine protease inhibitor 27A-like [Sitodiplosis mosellana]XP_055302789.1 serine protease inhibitor 27A-like [Sitodiplosis mosellana]
MSKILFLFVCSIVIFCDAQSQVDVDKLFHANPPSLSPNRPPNVQRPLQAQAQSIDSTNPIFESDDELKPYRGSRHDEFDWALTKKVLDTNEQENTVVSPFLVKLLLSILAEAAGQDTSTHRELLTILPSIRTEEEIRELYGRTFGSLLKESSDYELNLGAKLFVDRFIQPRQKFAAIIKSFYYSDVESVDFARSQEAANIINSWCANATKNHINDIVTPDDVARSVILLINTIYFNGYWSKPFAENQTVARNFNINSKASLPANFMTKTDDFYYSESTELDAKVLRLPYKGYKFAMYIVLPNKVDGLDELISRVDSSYLHRTQILMEKVEVKVSIPKFKFTNTVKLNEILKALGIRQMFTLQASFPQLVRGNVVQDRLQVSNVLQRTGIEVNEKGSTAYAATIVSLVNKFGASIEFNADRPFLFLIEDETTSTLIFTGKVTKPE